MNKALVTFANGPHEDLLEIALPSFEEFADRHGYDLLIPAEPECARPPSWFKVAFLLAALQDYEEAVWVDADMVIIDPTDDLDVPADAWHALVEHSTGDGMVPNCGLWLVRQPMVPVLEQVWGMEEHVHGPWWEQSAVHELMGYAGRPVAHVRDTELYEHTHFLDKGWNCHLWDRPPADHPRVLHATMFPDRRAAMTEWAGMARAAV